MIKLPSLDFSHLVIKKTPMYDVAIVGGGPAGLSAGLVLARSRRKIIVIDSGHQRNLHSRGLHGYLTRDGIPPEDFLALAQKELQGYSADFCKALVTDVDIDDKGFRLTATDGGNFHSKKILISTGIKDNIPPLPGIDTLYGKSVFHCPYCDGWESRDKKIALYANSKSAFVLSLSLKTWSGNVFICSDGPHRLRQPDKEFLDSKNIKIFTEKIRTLIGENGQLKEIEFFSGKKVETDVMFFSAPQYQRSALAEKLGCKMSNKGYILFGKDQSTNIKGLFVAGDAVHDMKFVIVAASEGAKAAVAINKELQEEEIGRKIF